MREELMAELNKIEAVAAGASEGRASAVKLRDGGVVSLDDTRILDRAKAMLKDQRVTT